MKTSSFVLILSTLWLVGCSFPMGELGLFKDSAKPLGDIQIFESGDKEITFEVLSEGALKSCSECHGFTRSAAGLIARKAAVMNRLNGIGGEIMPPPSKGYTALNECQKKMVETFFDDQAAQRSAARIKDIPACATSSPEPTPAPTPEATPTPAPTPTPTPEVTVDFKTLELSFENLQATILGPKCMKCHTEAAAKATILESLTFMQAQELLGNPAETSTLYKIVIPGMASRLMPPPRSGIPPLTADEAEYLKRWIESVPASEWE